MIIYFSGTGNSRYCAQMLAHKLNDETIDAAQFIKHGIAAELISDKPWVFVCPIYAWQIPKVFADFIKSGSFSGHRQAYFVLTCGGDSGNAQTSLKALCADTGFEFMGITEVVMPDNYIVMFKAPTAEKSAQIIAKAKPTLEQAIEKISSCQPFATKNISLADRLKSGFINTGFNKFYIKADKFYTTEGCIGCGKCVELCPLGNLTLKDEKPLWGSNCTQCMACICGCPTQAIEYGKSTKGKHRYQCPEYNK